MSKKILTLVSMILVLAMLLTACGGAATPAPARHAGTPPRRPPPGPSGCEGNLEGPRPPESPHGGVHEYLQ